MGVWGIGPFDNDDAADWAYELDDEADLSAAHRALAASTDNDGYLEVPEGSAAVAAAAVVAATFDGEVRDLPEAVAEWVDARPGTATRGDALLALDALDRVMSEDSELPRLWAAEPAGPAWAASIVELRARLVRASGGDAR